MHTKSLTRLAATAALTGAILIGSPATAATADPTSPTMTCSEVWQSLSPRLQGDLVAARSLPPRAQHYAMRAINRAALLGAYGEDVQHLAQARRERRQELWAVAPAQLKADVKAARSLGFHEQRRAMRVIRRAALAGVYGEGVQSVAQARQDWLQDCPKSGDAI